MGGAQVILATAPSGQAIAPMVDGLARRGKLLIVAGASDPMPIVPAMLLSGRTIAGWPSGVPKDPEDTLNFAAMTGVRPMIEIFPLQDAAKAYEHMLANRVRFRSVLTFGTHGS